MIRLYALVEGKSEETFIKEVLAPHLRAFDVWLFPIIVTTKRSPAGHKQRGGGHWKHWQRDLKRVVGQHASSAWVTTFFDLYGLPSDFPNRAEINAAPTASEKACSAEAVFREATALLDPGGRLIPYIQSYEFETLVLASLDSLAQFLEPHELVGLAALREEISALAPEEINGGVDTAPSKRLKRHLPGYDKVLHGEYALATASIPALAEACPRFGAWVQRLEQLGRP